MFKRRTHQRNKSVRYRRYARCDGRRPGSYREPRRQGGLRYRRATAGRISSASIFPTGTKPVYRLRTKAGYELKLTADHKVWTENRGDVPLPSCAPAIALRWLVGLWYRHTRRAHRVRHRSRRRRRMRDAASNATGRGLRSPCTKMKPVLLEDIASGINEMKADFADDGRSRRPTTVTMPAERYGLANLNWQSPHRRALLTLCCPRPRKREKALTDAVYTLDRAFDCGHSAPRHFYCRWHCCKLRSKVAIRLARFLLD